MSRFAPSLDHILIGSAIVLGWWLYGWRGLVLALTMIVFWMVLQFSRTTRLLREAATRPLGRVDQSVVMLQTQLQPGMSLAEVIRVTGSLGKKVSEQRDDWMWTDAGGDDIVVSLRRGVVVRWAIARNHPQDDDAAAVNETAGGDDQPK